MTYNKLVISGQHAQQQVDGTQQQQQTMKASMTAIARRNIQIYIESFQKSLKDVHSSVTVSPALFPLSRNSYQLVELINGLFCNRNRPNTFFQADCTALDIRGRWTRGRPFKPDSVASVVTTISPCPKASTILIICSCP